MSSRKNLQTSEIELILDSESDAYSEEEEHGTPLLPSTTATLPRQQQPLLNWGLLSQPIRVFMHLQGILEKRTTIDSGSSPLEVFVLFSCRSYPTTDGGDEKLIPPIFGHTGRRTLLTLIHD
jgi:hypothetical protein